MGNPVAHTEVSPIPPPTAIALPNTLGDPVPVPLLAPPAPTVTVIGVPVDTEYDPYSNPPPPPPPVFEPKTPPPPATTNAVTDAGALGKLI